jgi:fluoroquinolone resistance protein
VSGAEFSRETFEGLNLAGRSVESSVFEECIFERCRLKETVLRDCTFFGCTFRECDLGLIVPRNSTFAGCRFEGSGMMGINWTEARWPRARLDVPLRFDRCVLSHSTFLGLDLKGVCFIECTLQDADFRGSRLECCDFSGSDLRGSVFHEADLSHADLSTARDYFIDVKRTKLEGAAFSLPEALSLLEGLGITLGE